MNKRLKNYNPITPPELHIKGEQHTLWRVGECWFRPSVIPKHVNYMKPLCGFVVKPPADDLQFVRSC